MASKLNRRFWNKPTFSVAAITAVLVAVGAFFDLPEKIKNAANVVSGSEPEQVVLPIESDSKSDVKVDASNEINNSSGNSNAVANPETNIEIGLPSTNVNQAPVIDNQSSATYGDQSQSVIVNSAPSFSKSAISSDNYQVRRPKEIIADLPRAYEPRVQPSTSSTGVSQSNNGSVLSPNNNQSDGNSISVGGNVSSESSSDTYNGTVYNGDVCEGAIGSWCAPESSGENDFRGANITGNSSQ